MAIHSRCCEKSKLCVLQGKEGRGYYAVCLTKGRLCCSTDWKSPCYYCLPYVFDRLKSANKRSPIVVVVSPLVALLKDYVALCCSRRLTAAKIGAEPGEREIAQVKGPQEKAKNCAGSWETIAATKKERYIDGAVLVPLLLTAVGQTMLLLYYRDF